MLFDGYKPKWLYEAMPSIYFGAGLLTIGLVGNTIGKVSGLILLAAGGIVWKLRRDHRCQHHNGSIPATSQVEKCGQNVAKLEPVVWQADFEVSHEGINKQHRLLFAMVNELIGALNSGASSGDIGLLLDDLIIVVDQHFQMEAGMLTQHDALVVAAHNEGPNMQLNRLAELRDSYRRGSLSAHGLVGFVAHDMIAQHLVKKDLHFCLENFNK